jgi:hypothetical protein
MCDIRFPFENAIEDGKPPLAAAFDANICVNNEVTRTKSSRWERWPSTVRYQKHAR